MSVSNTAIGSALVRRPGPRLAEGIVTHIDRVPVDVDLAFQQWDHYVQTLTDNGWDIIEVTPADDCPDAVFIEDTVVLYRNLAIITNPGADSRKREITAVAKAIEHLGFSVNAITPPGTLDGGDVLKVGNTIYVGRGDRTNAEGVRQLRAMLEPFGSNVIAVPLNRVLHLKSAVTALPDGTIIGYPPLVDDPNIFSEFRPMPEESGAHVVLLGQSRLLVAASCPKSAELFRELGYDPIVVDISEFEKLEGCVTCLSVRLRP